MLFKQAAVTPHLRRQPHITGGMTTMESRYDYLLIGSFAAVWAAQSIREHDKTGTIAIVGDEDHPPYDRPPLSKNYLQSDDYKADDAYSKYDDFYPKNNIDLHKGTGVIAIDRAAQSVTLANGTTLGYGKLLLATGSSARPLTVPGANRPQVYLLRKLDDAENIRQAFKEHRRLVIIGAGYIGMEVAADARSRGLEVTVIEPKGHPWSKFASERFGRFLQGYYERQGVQFILGKEVVSIDGEGTDGPAQGVTTQGGRVVTADFVLGAVGASLNTQLAQEAGLEVDEQQGVRVNEYLRTADPHIWVAGDIAYFTDVALDKQWHCEHHLNAKWQGQAAGANMAGINSPYDRVPYFFSDEFDIHMILRGDTQGGKHSIFSGDVEGAEFVELYYNDEGRLTMGIAISHDEPKLDPISDTLERLIRARVNIKGREAEIQIPGFDLNSLLTEQPAG
jgi:3-phenylpropionate/trans-cinnamate dioxygenase ferredoxin reductase component